MDVYIQSINLKPIPQSSWFERARPNGHHSWHPQIPKPQTQTQTNNQDFSSWYSAKQDEHTINNASRPTPQPPDRENRHRLRNDALQHWESPRPRLNNKLRQQNHFRHIHLLPFSHHHYRHPRTIFRHQKNRHLSSKRRPAILRSPNPSSWAPSKPHRNWSWYPERYPSHLHGLTFSSLETSGQGNKTYSRCFRYEGSRYTEV